MRKLYSVLTAASVSIALLLPVHANAGEFVKLGYGRLVNNDFLGDFKDRGQTGSYVSSRVYGRSWDGSLPSQMGEILEFRLQADIKSPENLTTPSALDRPYAGSVSLGLHTHYETGGMNVSIGGELVAVGPQTGLDQFQTALHDGIGVAPPSLATKTSQIGNKFFPGVIVEMSKAYSLGSRTQVRPFVEGRGGVETLLRAGIDFEIGKLTQGELMVRDGITGQRYRTMNTEGSGVSFVVGFDTAKVGESAYLPANRGLTLSDHRDRARAGIHWQRNKSHGFFGVTYLGREFTSQTSPQVVGSIRLALKF